MFVVLQFFEHLNILELLHMSIPCNEKEYIAIIYKYLIHRCDEKNSKLFIRNLLKIFIIFSYKSSVTVTVCMEGMFGKQSVGAV